MYWIIIYLVLLSPAGSSDLPEAAGPGLLLFGLASGWGLQSPFCYQKGGELLPRLSTLTGIAGGLFLLHWPWSHLHRVLPGILALGSPDFPLLRPFGTCSSDYLADLRWYSSIRSSIYQVLPLQLTSKQLPLINSLMIEFDGTFSLE